jgi:predicted metal-dependent peptidase
MAYGERGRHRHVVDLADRRALERWRPADPEVTAEAQRLKEAALLDFGLSESPVASWLYAKCRHQIATTAVGTAAVVASGDGSCLLLYNPEFFVALGLDGVKFVLFHEARHLVHRHLYAEPELRADPVFTLAAEVSINWWTASPRASTLRRSTAPTPRIC